MLKVNTARIAEFIWSSPEGEIIGAGKEISEELGRVILPSRQQRVDRPDTKAHDNPSSSAGASRGREMNRRLTTR